MADKKKTNFWEDPVFQSFYNPLMIQGLVNRNAEQNRLNTLQNNIYGASGALATNKIQETAAQNRLAEEMANRGRLHGGAYSGAQKGAATLLQGDYNTQRQGIENQYTSQTNDLLDKGLKLDANGQVSPLAPGEEISWTNPATGKVEKAKYDWSIHTSAGRQARASANIPYVQATAKTAV